MNPVAIELAQALVRNSPKRAAAKVAAASPEEIAELLHVIDTESATILLRNLAPLVGAQALALMTPEAAGRLVERLGPQRAAVLIGRMEKAPASRLMGQLEANTQTICRRLLNYRPDQAASRMDPLAPAVSLQATAAQALELVRRAADNALHYVYVLDDEHRLVGVVSMRELMLSPPATLVSTIMTPSPERLHADDPLSSVVVNPGWRRTHALPVVDEQGRYLGVIRYSMFRTLEAELGHSHSGPDAAKTADALAELLWLGTSAIGRMGGAAILGERRRGDKS